MPDVADRDFPVAKVRFSDEAWLVPAGTRLQVRAPELAKHRIYTLTIYGGRLSLIWGRTRQDEHVGEVSYTNTLTFLQTAWEEDQLALQVNVASEDGQPQWREASIDFLREGDHGAGNDYAD